MPTLVEHGLRGGKGEQILQISLPQAIVGLVHRIPTKPPKGAHQDFLENFNTQQSVNKNCQSRRSRDDPKLEQPLKNIAFMRTKNHFVRSSH